MATNEWEVIGEQPAIENDWEVLGEEDLTPDALLPGEALNLATAPDEQFGLGETQASMASALTRATSADQIVDDVANREILAAPPRQAGRIEPTALTATRKNLPGGTVIPEPTDPDADLRAMKRLPGNIGRSAKAQVKESIAGTQRLFADLQANMDLAKAESYRTYQSDRPDVQAQQIAAAQEAEERAGQAELAQARAARTTRGAQAEGQAAIPADAGPIEKAIQSGVSSAAVTIPIVTLGSVVPGGQGAALVTLGGLTGSARYGELRAAGLDEGSAALSAAALGGLEGLTEKIPLGALAKKSPFIQKAAEFLVQDVLGENVATAAQLADDYRLGLRDDVTMADVQQALQETTAATIAGAGAQLTVSGILEQALDRANQKALDREAKAGMQRQEPLVGEPELPGLGEMEYEPAAIATEQPAIATAGDLEVVGEEPMPAAPGGAGDELAALEALRKGAATPEQEAIVEGLGHLVRTETGAPVLLPSGRRRLTELRSSTGAIGEQRKGQESAPGLGGVPAAGGQERGTAVDRGGEGAGVLPGGAPSQEPAPTPAAGVRGAPGAAPADPSGAAGSLEDTQEIPAQVEQIDLTAVRDNNATPGQIGMAVEKGYAKRRTDGTAMLLPAGRRRLIELESGQPPADFEATFEGDDLRRAGDRRRTPRVEVKPSQARSSGVKTAGGGVTVHVDGKPAIEFPDEQAAREAAAGLAADGTFQTTVAGQDVAVNVAPTDAQKIAGNYRKGKVRYEGLDISIENPKGSIRSGVSESGRKWSSTLRADYGYVRGSEGADGDHVDIYLTEKPTGDVVYVIDQTTPDGKKFDEWKVVLGAESEAEARALYLANYPKGWKGVGAITAVPLPRFKELLYGDAPKKPLAWKAGAPRASVSTGVSDLAANERQVPQPQEQAVSRLRSKRDQGVSAVATELRNVPAGRRPPAIEGNDDRARRQQQGLRAGQREVDTGSAPVTQSAKQSVADVQGKDTTRSRLGEGNRDTAKDAHTSAVDVPVADREGADRAGESKVRFQKQYPKSPAVVDGRKVRGHVPNRSSIAASISNYEELPGVREVRMDQFTLDEAPLSKSKRVASLAEEIRASGEINPLIVGVDEKGPYIIEGAHRYDALKLLGAKSFPAVVVVDRDATSARLHRKAITESAAFRMHKNERDYRRIVGSPKGQRASKVGGEVDRVLRGFPNAAVTVTPTFNELPNDVRARVIAAGGLDENGDPAVDAFYDPPTGQVYFIAAEIESLDSIEPLFMHEYVAHKGLAGMLDPAKRDEILNGIARDLPDLVRQKAADYGYRFHVADERRIAAEEVIAEMAETYLKGHELPAKQKGILQRLFQAIADVLRRLGLRKYDEKYIASLLTDLHRYAREGHARKEGAELYRARASTAPAFPDWDDSNASEVVPNFADYLDRARLHLSGKSEDEIYSYALKQFDERQQLWQWEGFFEGGHVLVRGTQAGGYDLYVNDALIVPDDGGNYPSLQLAQAAARTLVAEQGGGLSDAEAERILDAVPLSADLRTKFHRKPFFSQLDARLSEVRLQKGNPSQWRGMISNLVGKGVSPEEIEWLGVNEWLGEQEGKVTKDQVLGFVRANQIQVEEVVKGGQSSNKLRQEHDQIVVGLTANGVMPDAYDPESDVAIETEEGDRWFYDEREERWSGTRDGTKPFSELPDEVRTLADRLVQARLLMREAPDFERDDETRYSTYTTPGGANYRELLLTLPEGSTTRGLQKRRDVSDSYAQRIAALDAETDSAQMAGDLRTHTRAYRAAADLREERDRAMDAAYPVPHSYKSAHWTEPNILAHVRFDERTDADGKRVLFIQEIQSDWHQEGRKHGYEKNDPAGAGPGVPDAPFKTSWPELAFKRMLKWAVDENFDRVAWTTGEQQNQRYSLTQAVSRVEWLAHPNRPDTDQKVIMLTTTRGIGKLTVDSRGIVIDHGESTVFRDLDAQGLPLAEVIGDAVAKRVLAEPAGDLNKEQIGTIALGGEGMIGFYDQMLPRVAAKITKKWGGKVGKTAIETGDYKWRVTQGGALQFKTNDETEAKEYAAKHPSLRIERAAQTAHSLDVTDDMREVARGGLPMFHRKSMVGVFRRRQAVQNGTFDLVEGSRTSRWWNLLVFKAQDRFYDLFRLNEQAKIFRQVAQLPDSMDAYLKETLYHGRVEDRVKEYEKQFVEPLVKMIKDSGYTWQQVEDYLYARHAPEANARLLVINNGNPNFHSGMTDAEATQVMTALGAAGNIAHLQAIGAHVDAMTQWERSTLVLEGLEDQATITEWENTYDHYVPLKGWAHNPELAEMPGRGRGFDTGGRTTKDRTGRTSRAGNILANIVAQAQMAVIRAEKAKVGRALLEFVKANPAPRLYEVNQIEYHRYIDSSTGLVRQGVNPQYKLADNVVRVRMSGKDEHIVFNPTEPQMQRLATAMKNLSANEMGLILSFLHGINRYLSTINTSLNPEFVISNALRDLQTAGINLQSTDLKGQALGIMSQWRHAWKAIRQAEAGNTTHAWAPWWERFKKAGAKTGWIQHYGTPVDIEKKLQKEINRHGVVGNAAKGIELTLGWIERQNLAVENAMRLATFRAAVDAGMSDERAAQIAKNLTVNFNKRGDLGVALNSFILFYNAGVQGTATILRAAKSPRARKFMYGLVAAGIVIDIVNRMVAGEDDDDENRYDKIRSYEKERNIIVMLPKEQRFTMASGDEIDHLKIPMPYGYNFLYYTGTKIGGVLDYHTIGNKRRFEPAEDAAQVVASFLGAFNPVGGYANPLESITAVEQYIQLKEERAWDGRPLMPPQPQYDIPLPDSQRYWRSASKGAREVTGWLNENTGGTEVTPGAIDISPATVDYWIDFALGGTGRFISNTINATHDVALDRKDLDLGEVPFVRRVLGQTGERDRQERFYTRMNEVQYVIKERDVAREMRQFAKTPEEMQPYEERNAFIEKRYPIAAKVEMEGRRAEAKIKQLRAGRKALQKQEGRMEESKRLERIDSIEAEINATMDQFNRSWNEAEDAQRGATDTKDLIGQLGPIIDGKNRRDAVRALREAGKPATAELIAALPTTMRAQLREFLEKEANS